MTTIDDMPNIIIPDDKDIHITYKHIQVVIDGKDFLRFKSSDYRHGDILEELLKSCDAGFEYMTIRGGEKIPRPKGNNYELVGAGFAFIIKEKKIIGFTENSFQYDKSTDERHLDRIKQYVPEWQLKKA